MPAAARALVFALWPLAAQAAAAPARPAAEVPPVRTSLRRLQEAAAPPAAPVFAPAAPPPAALPAALPGTPPAAPPAATGQQWTAPAEPEPGQAAPVAAVAPPAGAVVAWPPVPTLPPISGPLEHMALDCWQACGGKAGYCRWCGQGNSCCRHGDVNDPQECATAVTAFLTLHHECVQTTPPAPTSPLPTAPAAGAVTLAPVYGVPTAAPPQALVPAGEALVATSTSTIFVNTSQAAAVPASGAPTLVPTAAPVVAPGTTTLDAMQINEQYLDRRDRFIRAPDGRATWFQDAQTKTKHLVRTGCKACGSPPPCENWLSVSKEYIHGLTLGEDFQCEMLSDSSPNGFGAAAYPTTTTMPQIELNPTTTTTQAASGGGFGSFLVGALVVLCCCAGAGGAAFWAMNNKGGRKASKKGKKTRGVKGSAAANGVDDDQVPLVLGQDSFSSHGSYQGEPVAQMGQREQMAAMAPTYTAMTPQMGQAQMAAQMAMQGQMPTQTNVQMGYQQQMAMQQGMPTYPAMQTQAAFGQEQEMELVTVTPNGLAVTPLAPGQQVPAGVPVLSQPPAQFAQPQFGMPPQQYAQPQYGMQGPGY